MGESMEISSDSLFERGYLLGADKMDSIQDLLSDNRDVSFRALRKLKNSVIGSDRQKAFLLKTEVVQRLLQNLRDESDDFDTKVESVVLVGSLASGVSENIDVLVSSGCVPLLLNGLASRNTRFSEACLRSLCTLFTAEAAPVQLLYDNASTIPMLLATVYRVPVSLATLECVAKILSKCCLNEDHQEVLHQCCAIEALGYMLSFDQPEIVMPTMKGLAALCYHNPTVGRTVLFTGVEGLSMSTMLEMNLSRDKPMDMQIAAAKCITYLCRAGGTLVDHQNPTQDVILYKVMPTLVRGCKVDPFCAPKLRVEAAETLAYLVEESPDLQRLTAVNNHCLTTLGLCLNYPLPSKVESDQYQSELQLCTDLRQAALTAFASLASSDEEIRRKIVNEVANLLDHIVTGVSELSHPKVQIAAAKCLHSLSRSVEQLRTTFQDKSVWLPLIRMIKSNNDELVAVTSAVLVNLTLEFSPCRLALIDIGVVQLFASLVKRDNPSLQLNGVWGLLNLAYKADEKTKFDILFYLKPDDLLKILTETTIDAPVVHRLLGLIRNLFSTRQHIDQLMSLHGTRIMQTIIFVLEEGYSNEVKEVALSILSNIANGNSSKDFVMSNEDVLRKIISYMTNSSVRLQTVATFCVANLAWKEDQNCLERQIRLKEMGVQKILQQLLGTQDTTLFEKVKIALQQFA